MKKHIKFIITQLKGNNVKKEYQKIKQIHNVNDLVKFQEKYLENLIFHSYENVPYYKKIFDDIGIINNEKVNLSRFKEIPILTKKLLQKHQKELISKDHKKRKSYYNSSGGSTGEPTMFLQDHIYDKWTVASNKYYYQDMLEIDESNAKKIVLWGAPQDLFQGGFNFKSKMINYLTNILWLNSFKMTEINMKSYIDSINKYKPDLIRGYAGSLHELAIFSEKNFLNIYTPKKLICSAETVTNEMRQKIESVFGTKLYNFYGSRETATLAGECKNGLIHIFSFNNYIEIMDRNNNTVTENQEGRVIVTNLHNYSMPLIRYEIGDNAILGPIKCTCGNYLPCLNEISGRLEEQFIKKDGSIVIGYFFVHLIGVLLNKGYIKKFQVIQEDYEKIRILAVLEKDLPEIEKKEIEQKIRVNMGTNCQILWDFVDSIPKTKSGKFLYTQSLIKR